MCHILLTLSFADGRTECFHVLTCEECCTGHRRANLSLRFCFQLFWLYPEVGVMDHGGSIFNCLRNRRPVFIETALISFPPGEHRGLLSPHPCQYLLFAVFLIITIPMGVRWYLVVVWICNSLMISWCKISFCAAVGHLYVFFESCVFRSFAQF